VPWEVELHDAFVPEFEALDEAVQDELLAHISVLEVFGPRLGRPRVDTLKGSRHSNMKELRFEAATASGDLRLHSIRSGKRSFCAVVTSREEAKSASIGS
jgi:hypothetical protein